MFEREHERVGVARGDADAGEVRLAAQQMVVRVAQDVKERGLWCRGGGGERAFDRVNKIVRRDGITVGPAGVAPQIKGPDEAVGGGFPVLGHAGQRRAAVRVGRDQTLAERPQDEELVGQRGELRVEGGGLVALRDAEDLGGCARFAPGTGTEERPQKAQKAQQSGGRTTGASGSESYREIGHR
jgi:hypothetical protein